MAEEPPVVPCASSILFTGKSSTNADQRASVVHLSHAYLFPHARSRSPRLHRVELARRTSPMLSRNLAARAGLIGARRDASARPTARWVARANVLSISFSLSSWSAISPAGGPRGS